MAEREARILAAGMGLSENEFVERYRPGDPGNAYRASFWATLLLNVDFDRRLSDRCAK